MKLTENAKTVLDRRYLAKDANNQITENYEGLFDRVASAIASQDAKYGDDVELAKQKFYKVMTELEFLPNSPTLMNAGRPLGQLSACFVLPIEDSMEAIFETIKQAALIHKSGGGTGFSFSRLRSKGGAVKTTGGVASGPVSFMKVFNMATEAVKQGGTRRGANMGILRVDHPDILEFIDCKKNTTEITNFNISIGITEAFMDAVISDKEYDLVDPNSKSVVGTMRAKDVYDKIVLAAWSTGEPGIIFLDRLNRDNVVPTMGEIESTNPCGEQPLLPYESCNLGSINLINMLMVKGDKYSIDYKKLDETIEIAVHFLDNVIDANNYPIPMIDIVTKKSRKIGLGVMGFADMLLLLGVPYNSEKGIEIADKVMERINSKAKECSQKLAIKRGAFPIFAESTYSKEEPLRNATRTTIAPTGTLSILANCSSGVEPIFAYAYIRNIMDNTEMAESNPILKEVLIKRGLYSDELMKKIAKEGTLQHIDEIPDDIKKVFVCAHDISPIDHILMQAAFQKHTDNAVSKTVNFTTEATKFDVDEAYKLAYKKGCKGITIYRDGSRQNQVLNIGAVNQTVVTAPITNSLKPRPRPEIVKGFTEKVEIGCGNLYVTVNFDDHGILEVFANTGKAGGCPSQSEATVRLVSTALRSGMDVDTIVNQLKGIRCHSTMRSGNKKVLSCPDAIGRVIEKTAQFMKSELGIVDSSKTQVIEKVISKKATSTATSTCPECGSMLEHEGGCNICRNCGYSKCG